MYSSKVDARTGAYNVSLSLGHIIGNEGFGPNYTLKLSYSTVNNRDNGQGFGWGLNLSRYDKSTQTLSLYTGGSYKLEWKNNVPTLRYHHLNNIHLYRGTNSQDLLFVVHKNGNKEYINQYGFTRKIENSRGHALYFHYQGNKSSGILSSISDQKNHALLKIKYTPTKRIVSTLNTQGKWIDTTYVVTNGHMQNITFQDGKTKLLFTYISDNQAPQLLHFIEDSTGSKEEITYGKIHIPKGAQQTNMYVVKTHRKDPGFQQPAIVSYYQFDSDHGHNYLGYDSGVEYIAGVDNLFMRPDSYQYQTRVLNDTGTSVVTTYNKYHLKIKEALFDPITGKTLAEKRFYYPNWIGKNINQLPANYAMATREESISYAKEDTAPLRDSLSHTATYDDEGNILSKTAPSGVSSRRIYGAPDHNGFKNDAIVEINTPAVRVDQPTLPTLKTQIKYETLQNQNKTSYFTIPVSKDNLHQLNGRWITDYTTNIRYDLNQKNFSYGLPLSVITEKVNNSSLAKSAKGDINKQTPRHYRYRFHVKISLAGQNYLTNVIDVQYGNTGSKFIANSSIYPTNSTYKSIYTGKTILSISPKGYQTGYKYDDFERIVEIISGVNSAYPMITHYTYKNSHDENSVIITLPNGYHEKNTYDGIGRSLGHYVERLNDHGKPIAGVWDIVSLKHYNALGKVSSIVSFDTKQKDIVTRLVATNHYNTLGMLMAKHSSTGHTTVSVGDTPLRRSIQYALDPTVRYHNGLCAIQGVGYACRGSMLIVTDKNKSGKTSHIYQISLDYNAKDDQGNLIYNNELRSSLEEHIQAYLSKGKLFPEIWLRSWTRKVISEEAFYNTRSYRYDGWGRMIQGIDTHGGVTSYQYDVLGQLYKKTLPNSKSQYYIYDDLGNLSQVAAKINGDVITLGVRVFNKLGELTRNTDAKGNTWHYKYNLSGHLISYRTPNGNEVRLSYDARNNLRSKEVKGKELHAQYYTYSHITNQLLSIKDATGITDYKYYINGRIKEKSHNSKGGITGLMVPDYHVSYDQYTRQGSPLRITDISGKVMDYIYDSQHRLSKLEYGKDLIASYSYYPSGKLNTFTRGKNIITTYSYDSSNRLLDLKNSIYRKDRTHILQSFHYRYYRDGNLKSRLRQDGALESYEYDNMNNLSDYRCNGELCPKDVQGNKILNQKYYFDAINNISKVITNGVDRQGEKTVNETTYQYDHVLPTRLLGYRNSLLSYGNSHTLIYDHDGNITHDGEGNVLTYTAFDQLASISHKESVTHYHYNAIGMQISQQTDNDQPLYYIYGANALAATMQNGKVTKYLYALGRIGKIDPSGNYSYPLTDQAGSVLSNSDSQGVVKNNYVYSPYGIQTDLSLKNSKASFLKKSLFGFNGHLTDPQSGFQFLGKGYARAYNPVSRRFMSQDSLSPYGKGGFNGYIYATNNPIMRHDPSGHSAAWMNWVGQVFGQGFSSGKFAGIGVISDSVTMDNFT